MKFLNFVPNFFESFIVNNSEENSQIYFDLHIHTNYSDSALTIKNLNLFLQDKTYLISITDHNEIKGGLSLKQAGINVVPGIELGCDDGFELLVYFSEFKFLIEFYESYVVPNLHSKRMARTTKNSEYYFEILKNYECFISIPHINGFAQKNFLKNKLYIQKAIDSSDAIEIYNHHLSKEKNLTALMTQEKNSKQLTFGSDAHSEREILSYCRYINKKYNMLKTVFDIIYKVRVIGDIGYRHIKYGLKKNNIKLK